jgi:hypothetical protein
MSSIQWSLNGMELDQLTCPRSTTSHCSISGKYSQTLRITNIKDSDEGEYKCSYAAGKNESYALTLTVINGINTHSTCQVTMPILTVFVI